jgi:di/tricarboxylate transporter
MTFEIALVLGILAISLVLFISEVIRMDLVALLVLGALAVTGLVDSTQAFAGFSNSAVITVWAMFILSEGLTRTGIADIIGRQVMRIGGKREIPMILVIMITGAVLSAFMNNIGVAALMLPVVVGVARRTRIPASRLLMPLAYSTLLGGLMTLIGTPPNLLISESMVQNGITPFALFDFTPLGGAVMLIGVLFVAVVGRFLLPKTRGERDKHVSQRSLRSRYKLQERTFMMRVIHDARSEGFDTRWQVANGKPHWRIDRSHYLVTASRWSQRDLARPANHHSRWRRYSRTRTTRSVSRTQTLERPRHRA